MVLTKEGLSLRLVMVAIVFRVFDSIKKIPSCGFAIAGCPEMNSDCLPQWYSFNIVCYVSRDCV